MTMQFIESQSVALPALRSKFEDLGSLYEKKLWHQLTEALNELLKEHGDKLGASLYTDFISHFEARLNQVRLVLLVSRIGHSFDDSEKSLELFNSLLKSRKRLGTEASMCVDMDIALVTNIFCCQNIRAVFLINFFEHVHIITMNTREKRNNRNKDHRKEHSLTTFVICCNKGQQINH